MKIELKITGVSGHTQHDGELVIATVDGLNVVGSLQTKDKEWAARFVKGVDLAIEVGEVPASE